MRFLGGVENDSGKPEHGSMALLSNAIERLLEIGVMTYSAVTGRYAHLSPAHTCLDPLLAGSLLLPVLLSRDYYFFTDWITSLRTSVLSPHPTEASGGDRC